MRTLTTLVLATVTTLVSSACNESPAAPVIERIVATPVPTATPKPSTEPKRAVRRESPSPAHDHPSGRASRSGTVPQPWQSVADCESGKRYRDKAGRVHIIPNTARWHIEGAHSGGLQFAYDTWRRAGGEKYAPTAGRATPMQQVEIAKSWLAKTSWAQWPNCSRILGLR